MVEVWRFASIIGGAAITALSLELFYIPHGFLDGGMTGLAVVIGRVARIPPVQVLIAVNIGSLLVGIRKLGQEFIGRAAAGLLTSGVILSMVGPLPQRLSPLAAAVFGGAGMGLGLGLVLRAGGALDGSEILGMVCRERYGVSLIWFLFWSNVLVFTLVAIRFGLAPSFHSMLAQGVVQAVLVLLLDERRR